MAQGAGEKVGRGRVGRRVVTQYERSARSPAGAGNAGPISRRTSARTVTGQRSYRSYDEGLTRFPGFSGHLRELSPRAGIQRQAFGFPAAGPLDRLGATAG